MYYSILDERKKQILKGKKDNLILECEKHSIAGSVSQRACVYSGARVVLNPITDAYHLIHGPIGCASYTWDIRGSLSSDKEVYRNSFCTDLKEKDIIFGGETKLRYTLEKLIETYKPEIIFVYSTCVVGVIGDDVEAVCNEVSKRYNVKIIPVNSSGFLGTKSQGYKAACDVLFSVISSTKEVQKVEKSINLIGDYNLAGETWIIENYLRLMGIRIISKITGDSKYGEIKNAQNAVFNVVQCAGSMTSLAKKMQERFDMDFIKVSFFGIEDTKKAFLDIAGLFEEEEVIRKTKKIIEIKEKEAISQIQQYKEALKGKRAAIYVGGGFKAISLIKQFRELGMKVVLVGSQTGKKEDYEIIKKLVDDDAIIVDDTNPAELELFLSENDVDILVGGVKERPLAYKLGIGFCDHNHERKHPLACFEGAVNFAKEVYMSVTHPVWDIAKKYEEVV